MAPAALQLLKQHPFWADAERGALERLAAAGRVVELEAGQMFVVEGAPAQHIYLLHQGAARVFYAARKDRPELTVKLMQAPNGFGDIACVMRTGYAASVQALTPACAVAIESATYFRELRREPRACFRQYWDVVRRFASASAQESASRQNSAVGRVIALLLAYSRNARDGLVALAQDDLAQQAGSNRRSVVRVMEQLYRSGGLKRVGRKYQVVNADALLALVGEDLVPDLVGTVDAQPWGERET